MQEELETASKKQDAKILITEIRGEIEYVETYLEKLKNKLEELELIINGL